VTSTVLRDLARAKEQLRALVAAEAAPPDPVELFRAAFGEPDNWQVDVLQSKADRLLLVDIDHSPRHLLHARHGAFYQRDGLRSLSAQLHPGGTFALWSDDPPDADFLATLRAVFSEADVRDVSLAGVSTVFADPARRSPRGAGPHRGRVGHGVEQGVGVGHDPAGALAAQGEGDGNAAEEQEKAVVVQPAVAERQVREHGVDADRPQSREDEERAEAHALHHRA